MTYYIGIDIGNKCSSICVVDAKGNVKFEDRIETSAKDFLRLKKWKGARCVVEASPLAETVCNWVESARCKIEILDPRQAKAVTQSKKKTDKLDARKLAQLCRTNWYQAVHRKSGKARELRTYLQARHQLVKTRVAIGNAIRGLLRAHGIVVPSGQGDMFVKNISELMEEVPKLVREALEPLLRLWRQADKEQERMYRMLGKIARKETVAKNFTTIGGVGPATAIAFMATVDDPQRFPSGEKLVATLGLVPRVYQSGDTEYRGRITKQGDPLLRWLLTESANALLLRSRSKSHLKEWGTKLMKEKGIAKARVAVARKLACVLLAIWKNNTAYLPHKQQLA